MKYSYSWLQKHIDSPLPKVEKLAEVLSMKSLEVEGIEGDILDVKTLPHRAHDVLSHRGLAREVAVLFSLSLKKDESVLPASTTDVEVRVDVTDSNLCPRYMAVRLDNVKVGKTPDEIKLPLESIGQRSISNIVDITNFVLNDIGQPMHAFDADKVAGGITVRRAKKGEKMTTLDDRELTLFGTETVIADDEGVLALAGVKGGKKAIVDEKTTSIIFESANFNSTATRKASDAHAIRTDSSKRFESGITSEFAKEGMKEALVLVKNLLPKSNIGKIIDFYPEKESQVEVIVSLSEINNLLGSAYTLEDVKDILVRERMSVEIKENVLTVIPPYDRLDIRIKEDVIEEVGRIMGYDNLPSVVPSLNRSGVPHKRLFYETKIKNILIASGYSEIYTYTFGSAGEVEIVKGLASDKEKLRTHLGAGVVSALLMNLHNAPLLGVDTIRVFEFGNVFSKDAETRHFSLAVDDGKKKSSYTDEIDFLLAAIKRELGASAIHYETVSAKPYCIEIDFDTLIAPLPEPTSYEPLAQVTSLSSYSPVSPYPFISRDIALWVPSRTTWDDIHVLALQDKSPLIVRAYPFDTFTKKDEEGVEKTSITFRIVLQSYEKTLTDDEANAIVDTITLRLKEKGYEIR
jgi:phenylalanyl-tRNA synthetase beta chain